MKFQNYMRDTHSVFIKGANEGSLLFLFEDMSEVVGTWKEAECLRLCKVYLVSSRMVCFNVEYWHFFFFEVKNFFSEHRTYDK